MFSRLIKYLLMLTIIGTIVGVGSWLVSRWFVINNPIPEGAIKVMGRIIGW